MSAKRNQFGVIELALIATAALPVAIAIFLLVADMLRQHAVAKDLQRQRQARVAAGEPVDNDSLSEYLARISSSENTGDWIDVMSSIRVLENEGSLLSNVQHDLQHPEAFVDSLTPAMMKRFERAVPIIDRFERLLADERIVWTPIIFNSYSTQMPDLQNMYSVIRLLSVELRVALASGDAQRALRDLDLMLRFAKVTQQDSSIISAVSTNAFYCYAYDMIRHTLAIDFWKDPQQLIVIERWLSAHEDLDVRWRRCTRSELALAAAAIENLDPSNQSMAGYPELSRVFAFGIPPSSKRDFMQQYDLTELDTGVGSAEHADRIWQYVTQQIHQKRYSVAWSGIPMATSRAAEQYLTPAWGACSDNFFRLAALQRWTRTAVAIKRFQLQEGRWPKRLDELAQVGLGASDWTFVPGVTFGYHASNVSSAAKFWTVYERQASMPSECPDEKKEDQEPRLQYLVLRIQ